MSTFAGFIDDDEAFVVTPSECIVRFDEDGTRTFWKDDLEEDNEEDFQ